MKWAGGKSQLLNELIPRLPVHYGRYIEPFFGGGAFFFALRPERALISDSNPELINMYKEVANNVDQVIDRLSQYKNTKEMFYDVRAQDWKSLSPSEAAARTLYLNKTCYNGLYRVNKKGQFNTPYGRYKNFRNRRNRRSPQRSRSHDGYKRRPRRARSDTSHGSVRRLQVYS